MIFSTHTSSKGTSQPLGGFTPLREQRSWLNYLGIYDATTGSPRALENLAEASKKVVARPRSLTGNQYPVALDEPGKEKGDLSHLSQLSQLLHLSHLSRLSQII